MNKWQKLLLAATISLAVTLVLVQLGIAIIESNTVQVVVHPNPALNLTVNNTNVFTGETVKLRATLSEGMEDQAVTFFQDEVSIGSNSTVDGVATYEVTLTNVGTEDLTVEFYATIP